VREVASTEKREARAPVGKCGLTILPQGGKDDVGVEMLGGGLGGLGPMTDNRYDWLTKQEPPHRRVAWRQILSFCPLEPLPPRHPAR